MTIKDLVWRYDDGFKQQLYYRCINEVGASERGGRLQGAQRTEERQ